MAKFQVAHIREQGQDMVIVLLNSQFHHLSDSEQSETESYLQGCARSAGLAGTVVLVWEYGSRMYFIAPKPWHPFFKSISLAQIAQNVNKELTCN